jgi:polysaccharide pyruvyl transferase WcaK-like protein
MNRRRGRTIQRWLIIGHFRGPNVGDEAMLLVLLRAISENGQTAVVSTKDGKLAPDPDLDKHRSFRRGIFGEIHELFRCDGLILGGGTYFHDSYHSGHRRLHHFASMGRYCLLFAIARLLGRYTAIPGAGIGPVETRSTAALTRIMLACSNSVVMRDAESCHVAKALTGRRYQQAFDLAVLLLDPLLTKPPSVLVENVVIGIIPAPIDDVELNERCWMSAAQAIADVSQETDALVRVFVFNEGTDSDYSNAALFERELGASGIAVEIVSHAFEPLIVARLMSECTAVVAARYHAGIFALMQRTPAVFIPYHPKLRHLADSVGLPECAVMDPEQVQSDRLSGALRDMLKEPDRFQPATDVAIHRDSVRRALHSSLARLTRDAL